MGYTNSALATVKILSPSTNHYGPRTHAIDRITPHMVVGQCTATSLGNLFALPSRRATSSYGIGYDGEIGLYCEEKNAPGTSSSPANDNRAVTIEIASDNFYPYSIKDAAAKAAIKLMADICRRNGKTVLVWKGSKAAALAYSEEALAYSGYGQKANEMLITFHEWFGSTNCPGAYIENHIVEWVNEVNKLLKGSTAKTATIFEEAQKMLDQDINGQARKNQATADGFTPEEVQTQIDLMLHKDKTAAIKSITSVMPIVQNGSTGDAVRILQKELQRMGYYSGSIDAVAGSITIQAIKDLQKNWNKVYGGYPVDGSFGPACWKKLLLG